ncbi:hypothetical protein FB45DRAFT_957988 [Roridomyces roridus]|uniref:Uncharacterized protein n=1 Tax=Roridomyces roridus TaxID=1738132 RepID=A0AAD7F8H5_9AGAR|nr:hypothetical protein FB45DRAFT_957988 [Roridomyces roridus]
MASATPDVRSLVWKRVLHFAVFVPGELRTYWRTRRFPLLLVSKLFYQLALPYYYAHTTLYHFRIPPFMEVLEKNPSLASHIRRIRGDLCGSDRRQVDETADWGATILAQTTGLEALVLDHSYRPGDHNDASLLLEGGISWNAFETMARLTALRSVIWKSNVMFDLDQTVPTAGLHKLTSLSIADCDASFLTASLSQIVVLAYRDAGQALDFLAAHGEKILDLTCLCRDVQYNNVFELCPNIRVLTLCFNNCGDWNIPEASSFTSRKVLSKTLAKLHLTKNSWSGRDVTIQKWESFLTAIKARCFPSLREIQVDCCKWPTNERAIAKDCWVQWAEMLLHEGISLSDAGGKKWRARLRLK